MDNPDYESFLRDYHAIIGALPPTTTAQPQKHVERLRALLHLWEEHSLVQGVRVLEIPTVPTSCVVAGDFKYSDPLNAADRVRLRPDLRVQRLSDGCRLATPFLSRDLRHLRYGRVLADLLVEGTYTVDDITARLAGLGAAPSEVSPPLDRRFQGGLLDTEVAPS